MKGMSRLKDLHDYLSAERGRKSSLEKALGISDSYLSQMLSGDRPMPAEICPAVEEFTKGSVSRIKLRPIDGHLIWPELARRPTKDTAHA